MGTNYTEQDTARAPGRAVVVGAADPAASHAAVRARRAGQAQQYARARADRARHAAIPWAARAIRDRVRGRHGAADDRQLLLVLRILEAALYGLLIPGSILAGLSVGVAFADMTDGISVLWGLALGFVGILLLGRALFGKQSSWPAIPAVILFAVGGIVAAANLPGLFVGGLIWLLLLIGAGLYLGWGRRTA